MKALILPISFRLKRPELLLGLPGIAPAGRFLQALPHREGVRIHYADAASSGSGVCVHGPTLPPAAGRSTEEGPVAQALPTAPCRVVPCRTAPSRAMPCLPCFATPFLASPSQAQPNHACPAGPHAADARQAMPRLRRQAAGFTSSLLSTSSSALHMPDNSCSWRNFRSDDRNSLMASARS